jgi:hypothetical protein
MALISFLHRLPVSLLAQPSDQISLLKTLIAAYFRNNKKIGIVGLRPETG